MEPHIRKDEICFIVSYIFVIAESIEPIWTFLRCDPGVIDKLENHPSTIPSLVPAGSSPVLEWIKELYQI